MTSIRDVARAAGVTPVAVSRTFSAPYRIGARTRQHILAVAQQLDYCPPLPQRWGTERRMRRSLRGHSLSAVSPSIGFQLFAETARPGDAVAANVFYAPTLAGAQAEAALFDLNVIVDTTNRHAPAWQTPPMIQEEIVRGLLVVGSCHTAVLERFAAHVPHIILIGSRDESGCYECVLSNDTDAGLVATRYLLDLGHRRIGFYGGERRAASRERLHGYVSALFEAQEPLDLQRIVGPDSSEWDHRRLLHRLLSTPDRPTALVAASAAAAAIAFDVCRDLGLEVPRDISLIGCDDIVLQDNLPPGLTTIHTHREWMGRLAVRCLHARLNHETLASAAAAIQHHVPVTVTIRDSCRPL